jgi:hypothetical protein
MVWVQHTAEDGEPKTAPRLSVERRGMRVADVMRRYNGNRHTRLERLREEPPSRAQAPFAWPHPSAAPDTRRLPTRRSQRASEPGAGQPVVLTRGAAPISIQIPLREPASPKRSPMRHAKRHQLAAHRLAAAFPSKMAPTSACVRDHPLLVRKASWCWHAAAPQLAAVAVSRMPKLPEERESAGPVRPVSAVTAACPCALALVVVAVAAGAGAGGLAADARDGRDCGQT